jgi:hypothetical protein
VQLDPIAFTHANESAGHRAAEGPHGVVDAVGEPHRLLDHIEVDDDFGGMGARDRGGDVGRLGELRDFLSDDLIVRDAHRYGGVIAGRRRVGDAVAAGERDGEEECRERDEQREQGLGDRESGGTMAMQ